MWRMLLPCGKLIGLLLFCLLFLISILFLKPNIRTLNTSRSEVARLVMGTIFLVNIYIQVKKKAFKINAKIEDVGLNED